MTPEQSPSTGWRGTAEAMHVDPDPEPEDAGGFLPDTDEPNDHKTKTDLRAWNEAAASGGPPNKKLNTSSSFRLRYSRFALSGSGDCARSSSAAEQADAASTTMHDTKHTTAGGIEVVSK